MESSKNPSSVLSDPLLHFVIIGAAIFGIYSLAFDDPGTTLISLPEGEVREFVEDYRARRGEEPNESLIEDFRQNWLSEEVLFREGVRLGLLHQDPVVRQRVVNKMQTLLAENAPDHVPDDETLKIFFRQIQHRYVKPPNYSFEVAALARSDMATPDEREAYERRVLRALNNGATPQLAGLRYQFYENNNTAAMRALWGEDFAASLSTLKMEDGWRRLDSKHGPLLVKLAGIQQSEVPDFEVVKKNLLADWRRQQQAAVVRRKVAELRKNYHVSWQGTP